MGYIPRELFNIFYPSRTLLTDPFSRFSDTNMTMYRPTNDYCTMRSIYSPNFCHVCLEGLWLALLKPLSLIDNVTQVAQKDGSTKVGLELLPLGEFRKIPIPHKEGYTILWYGANDQVILPKWTNKTSAVFASHVKEFGVEVRFRSEQIRVDKEGVLIHKERFTIN